MSESGFDPGLADPARAGVFFVTEDDLGPLSAVGRDAGLLARRIDLSGCDTKSALLLRIATVLDFPQTSGRNWDALSDSLRDLEWLPGKGYVLLFEGAGDLHGIDEADFDTLVSILDEANAEWKAREVAFWAFLALRERDFAEFED